MPKSREADDSSRTCSFCGQNKEDVPLLVISNVTKAGVCSWCALGVVEQTFKHGLEMEEKLRAMYKPKPKIEIVPAGHKPDKVDLAVAKALKKTS